MSEENPEGAEASPPEAEAMPAEARTPVLARRTDPNLTAMLRADYDALQNDFRQANELAADFQRQLSGKSNEFAELKRLFEKTQHDLVHLQTGITALRQERHSLALEAMRAVAFERRLKEVSSERERLRGEIEVMRQGLASEREEMTRRNHEYAVQVTRLTMEVQGLKQRLANGRNDTAAAAAPRTCDPGVRQILAEISDSLQTVIRLIDPAGDSAPPPRPHRPGAEPVDESIDISFGE